MKPCKKVLGADYELANAMAGHSHMVTSVREASQRLLDEIAGFPRTRGRGGTLIEWGRRFLSGNGGSAYIDSDHLEINLPEHTRAADHAAHVHAGFRIAQRAHRAATEKMPRGGRIHLLANVSDGTRSWGSHLNVCVTRGLWDDLFTRKPHLAGFLATHLATATLYTGLGQVGAGNGRSACDYQLAQRPDFFEEFVSSQTMHRRPILNMRDEAHAGDDLARMHIIFFDNALMPTANYLKAGTTQLVLALLEAGWVDPALLLDDPLAAAWEVSRDLSLSAPLKLAGRGRSASAVEIQERLADLAAAFVASGELNDAVPGADEILTVWKETLAMLRQRDVAALARRVDWALKFVILDRQIKRSGLSWDSPEIRALDVRYASLDPQDSLFLKMAAAGQVEGMPSDEAIERFADEPPEDSRAYLRAHLLRRLGEEIAEVEWDRLRFRAGQERYRPVTSWLGMPDPAGWTKEESDPILERCQTATDFLEAVGPPPSRFNTWTGGGASSGGGGRRGWSSLSLTTQDW
jgi:proteasome accessory factor A